MVPVLLWSLRKERFDIVYSNSSCTPIGYLVSRLLRVPHIWHVREFGREDFGLVHDFGPWPFQVCAGKSEALIAISKAVRWRVLGRAPCPVAIVYNGVFTNEELSRLPRTRAHTIGEEGCFVFGIVGQITRGKSQADAIRALSALKERFPGARLIIAGDYRTHYGSELLKLVRHLRLENEVEFTGYVHSPWDILARLDCFLMCSRWEGMGRVTAEAMTAGLPVIGFDNAATPELVRDNITGLLYRDGYKDLAEKMEHLAANPELARAMGAEGARVAEKMFSVESYGENIFQIMKDVMKKHRDGLR
jgi:glycosyltransferase involved in cell wall biosynthesis